MNNRPYILCYMMMTVDGRIDCPMLTKVSEGIGYDVIMKQLDAGLLDEVAILLGPAIDGRANMKAVFDGLPEGHEPVRLKLKGVTTYDDGAMLIRYTL